MTYHQYKNFRITSGTKISILVLGLFVLPSWAVAEEGFVVKPLVEKKVSELPTGDLYWRIDNFDSKKQAQNAAGADSLVAEYDGKVWLFTLGHAGDDVKGGRKVAELGPIPRFDATEYLLRINQAGGPEGSATPVHTHPGSEAFYVVAGELSQKTPHGVTRVAAGQTMVGHGANTPMQVTSIGTGDLRELALFVVDANKPFSTPSQFP